MTTHHPDTGVEDQDATDWVWVNGTAVDRADLPTPTEPLHPQVLERANRAAYTSP